MKTAGIQKELEKEKAQQTKLSNEINQLQQQLQEAKNGLMAAARLSDQLELNQHTIERLNNESKFKNFKFLGSVNFYLTSCSDKTIFHHSFFFAVSVITSGKTLPTDTRIDRKQRL